MAGVDTIQNKSTKVNKNYEFYKYLPSHSRVRFQASAAAWGF